MSCRRCKSLRILYANGKSSDCNNGSIGDKSYEGYIPDDLGIGGGDNYSIKLCLDCGQLQGDWPLPISELEVG